MKSSRLLIGLLAAAAAIGTTACGTPSGESGGDTSSIVLATNGAPATLDVNTVDDTPAQALVAGNVLEGLTRIAYDAQKNITFVPVLATSWDKTSATQWRFHLRKGVKFQDGSDMNADDVAYSINRRVEPDSEGSALYAYLDHATKVDDYTVDVFMKQPFPYIDRVVSGIMITPDGWGKTNKDQATTTAIGTGPYQLASYTQGGNDAVLQAFPGYWGPQPDIKKVEVRVIPDAGAALAALRTGEVDLVANMSPDLLAQAPKTIKTGGNRTEIARLDTRVAPFNNLQVRKAINLAVDRGAIIKNLRLGFAEPTNNQLVPAFVDGYNPGIQDPPYDPAQAKQLVQQAGATGAKVSISCASDQLDAAYRAICQAVAQAVSDIGMVPDLKFSTHADWLLGLYAPSKGQPTPSIYIQQTASYTFESGATLATWLGCKSTRNTYCDPNLQKMLDAASQQSDPAARTKMLQDVAATAAQAYPFIMLDTPETAVGASASMDGVLYPQQELTYWPEWKKSANPA